MTFRRFLSAQIDAAQQTAQFVADSSNMLTSGGEMILDPGQPLHSPYCYYDEDSGELVELWRTPEDIHRQARYLRYRAISRTGMRQDVRKTYPELVKGRSDGHEPEIRAFDVLQLISDELTQLTLGGGVSITTGIREFDESLKDIGLDDKVASWSNLASKFDFIGIELKLSDDTESFNFCQVDPDHLFIVKDPDDVSSTLFIAKRTWMPMSAIRGWRGTSSRSKISSGRPSSVDDKGGFTLTQTGFVFEERHYRGMIIYNLYAVSGDRILGSVPLHLYDRELAKTPVYLTGMRDFAITIFGNADLDGEFRSDWDSVIDLVGSLSARSTRFGRLVDRYSAPRELVPSTHMQVHPITGQVSVATASEEAYIIRPTDQLQPGFLQPNADFTGPQSDIEHLVSMIGILSRVPHALDPNFLESEVGVAIKLKLGPALGRVKIRRQHQENAVKTLVLNLMSAIEYRSSSRISRDSDADEKALLGLLEYHGPISEAIEKGLTDVEGQRSIHITSVKPFSFTGLQRAFTLTDSDSRRVREEVLGEAADDYWLKVGQGMGAIPTDGATLETDEESGDQFMQPQPRDEDDGLASQDQKAMRGPVPDVVTFESLMKQAQAILVSDQVKAHKLFRIEFLAGIPQDEASARDEVGEQLRSRMSYFTGVRGMTKEDAVAEIDEIEKESSRGLGRTDDFGGGFGFVPDPVDGHPVPVMPVGTDSEADREAPEGDQNDDLAVDLDDKTA